MSTGATFQNNSGGLFHMIPTLFPEKKAFGYFCGWFFLGDLFGWSDVPNLLHLLEPCCRRFLMLLIARAFFWNDICLSILNGPEQATFSNLRNDFSFDYQNTFQLMLESLQKITSLALLKDQNFLFFQFNTLDVISTLFVLEVSSKKCLGIFNFSTNARGNCTHSAHCSASHFCHPEEKRCQPFCRPQSDASSFGEAEKMSEKHPQTPKRLGT